MEPEEDFQTWLMISSLSLDSVLDFNVMLPTFRRLVKSIEETGLLPSPISQYTEQFFSSIEKDFVWKMLRMERMNEESCNVILDFLKIVIDLLKFGINTGNKTITKCVSIFIKRDYSLYKNNANFNFFNKICDYSYIKLYDDAWNAIKNSGDLKMIIDLFIIIITLSRHDNNFSFWELADICIVGVRNYIDKNLREAETNQISQLFEYLKFNAFLKQEVEQSFVLGWLDIFKMFISCEYFEKQLFGFKGINTLLAEDLTKHFVIDWLRLPENLDLFSGKIMHNEFNVFYTNVLSTLAEYDILDSNFLNHLWNLHKVQHDSEQLSFFMIFNSISRKINANLLVDFVKMCIKPSTYNENWINFISQFGYSIGNRNDSEEAFELLKDKLFDLSLTENPIQVKAQKTLSGLLSYYLTSEKLEKYIKKFLSNSKISLIFSIFQNAVLNVEINNEALISELVELAVDHLLKYEQDRSICFIFLQNICCKNLYKLPNNLIDKTFGAFGSSQFSDFITKIVNSKLISFDYLEEFLEKYPTEKINLDFFLIVKSLIIKINNYNNSLTKVKFKKEDLLWNFATIENPQRANFASFLCKIYASNDGFCLQDMEMIRYFIEKCNIYIDNGCNLNCLFMLIITFIETIESNLDISLFGAKRHGDFNDTEKITVDVSGVLLPSSQTHQVSGSMKISALKHRISKFSMIPTNHFKLTLNQKPLLEYLTVGAVANQQKKITVSVCILDEDLPYNHERRCLPCFILSQSNIANKLLDFLKDNNSKAKELLNYLPTNQLTSLKVKEIFKKNSFNYSSFLQVEYPNLFMYNFESIIEQLNENTIMDFERTGGFEYLIQNSNRLLPSIIPILQNMVSDDLILKHSKMIFDTILLKFLNYNNENSKSDFNILVNFLLKVSGIKDFSYTLPNSYYKIISSLLFSKFDFIEDGFKSILRVINVPLSAFVELLTSVPKEKEDDFYNVLSYHANEYNDIIVKKCLNNLDSVSLLAVLHKMLENNVIPSEYFDNISKEIVNKYLTINSKPRNKESFSLALKCLSHIDSDYAIETLNSYHKERNAYNEWGIDGDSSTVSSTGYSGLINLGATCFLDSTLQQFYGIPQLRKAIIEYEGDDLFMKQLKILFAKLLLSKGRSISTSDLVKEWVGWDGEKMNPRIQQDACDFSQMLIDKLEKGLGQDFIKSLFGISIIDTIEGISEEYHSTSSQPLSSSLTLPIINTSNIYEAFTKFQAPDYFTGSNQIQADKLGKKIDAKKFASLGILPKHLIIQLSRFEFNYSTWEKRKIDSPFEFPINIDLKPYTILENKNTKYALCGVIIHSGTANYGHYFSYVKNRNSNKWYNFNDSYVSEITQDDMLQSAYGKKDSSNGYILFYDRTDIDNKFEDIIIDKELTDIINSENHLNDEYRLFCSSAYFEYMVALSASKNLDAINIAIQYYFDTFPFTTHTNKAKLISSNIINSLKENKSLRKKFQNLLSCKNYSNSLLYSQSNILRKYTQDMFELLDPNYFDEIFLTNYYSIIDNNLLQFYRCFNEYFKVLSYFLKSNNVYDYSIQIGKREKLIYILMKDIPKYLHENPKIKPSYFYSGIDLSGLIASINSFELTDEFINYILDDEIMQFILVSKTNQSEIINIFEKINDKEKVKSFMYNISIHCGIHLPFFSFVPLLFKIFNDDAFDLIDKSHLKVGNSQSNDFDLACSIASQIKNNQELSQVLLNNLDKWLPRFLANENENCRIATMYIIAFITPFESFKELISFPHHENSGLFGTIVFSPKEVTNEIIMKAHLLLDFLRNRYSYFAQIMNKERFIGNQYISIIKILSQSINIDIADTLISLLKELNNRKKDFDFHVKTIFSILSHDYPERLTLEIINDCMPPLSKVRPEQYTKVLLFLESIETLIDKLEFTEKFSKSFIERIAFTTFKFPHLKINTTILYLRKIAKLYPKYLVQYISTHFDRIVAKNYSTLLVSLEETKTKMPLLNYLSKALMTKQFYDIDTLVSKTFELNEGEVSDESMQSIIEILNSPEVKSKSRNYIWELIYKKRPPYYVLASVYSWHGDLMYYTKYLLNINGNFNIIIENSKNSIDSFNIAYEHFIENHLDDILSSKFYEVFLKNPIEPQNVNIITKYLQLLTKDEPKEKIVQIIAPIIKSLCNHIGYLIDILEDYKLGSLKSDDINPIFPPLHVISNISFELLPKDLIQQFKSTLSKIKLEIPELKELNELLNNY